MDIGGYREKETGRDSGKMVSGDTIGGAWVGLQQLHQLICTGLNCYPNLEHKDDTFGDSNQQCKVNPKHIVVTSTLEMSQCTKLPDKMFEVLFVE